MKKTNNMFKVFIAAISLFSVAFLSSCNKSVQDKAAVQGSSVSDATESNDPVALWNFDSSWTESVENLVGLPRNRATFSSTAQAHDGISSFLSLDSGYVAYTKAGKQLPKLRSLTVDFWLFPYANPNGAQCVWCLPQTGAFWPDQHVLLDGYNSAQGDTGLIKVMFKANEAIPYNEEWQVYGGIPNFYGHWDHIQYSYNGNTSKFTLIVNGKTIANKVVQYTDAQSNGGEPLGYLQPNPGTHGILFGAFQNQWNPTLFGTPQPWMMHFKGRIDAFQIYNKALF